MTGLPEYTLLVGAGKSGTKRVLRLLNASRRTYCRCEPNAIPGSPYGVLPDREVVPANRDAMEKDWDRIVCWTAESMGERDRLPWPPKDFARSGPASACLWQVLPRGRVRAAWSLLNRGVAGRQWKIPRALATSEGLGRSHLVIKTGPAAAWAGWVMDHRPGVRVLHVVRHPAGFVNSYRGRWLAANDAEEARRANVQRLVRIAALDSRWAGVFPPAGGMDAVEAELWYWRYSVETTHAAGADSDCYLRVRDEDVAGDAARATSDIYAFCGLAMEASVRRFVETMTEQWRNCRRPWRELVSEADAELVQRVLRLSPLERWWSDQELVSTFDYRLE